MNGLLKSRKFWIAVSVFIIDVVLLMVRQFAPEWTEFTQALLAPLNGLALVVIGGIALEDAGAKASGAFDFGE